MDAGGGGRGRLDAGGIVGGAGVFDAAAALGAKDMLAAWLAGEKMPGSEQLNALARATVELLARHWRLMVDQVVDLKLRSADRSAHSLYLEAAAEQGLSLARPDGCRIGGAEHRMQPWSKAAVRVGGGAAEQAEHRGASEVPRD